jgi:Ca2+-binding RTX toxin-like protein
LDYLQIRVEGANNFDHLVAESSSSVSFSNGLAVGSKISLFIEGYGFYEIGEVDAASTQSNVIIKFIASASLSGLSGLEEVIGALKYKNSAQDQSYSAEREIVVSLQIKDGAKVDAKIDLTVSTGTPVTFLSMNDENIVGSQADDVFILDYLNIAGMNSDMVDGRDGYDVLNVNTFMADLMGVRNVEQINGTVRDQIIDITEEGFRSVQVIDLKYGGGFLIYGDEIDLRGKSITGVSGFGVVSSRAEGPCTVTVDDAKLATIIIGHSFNDTVILTQGRLTAEERATMYSNGIDKIVTPTDFSDKLGKSTRDVLKGSDVSNVLNGGAGSDVLYGKGGRDFFLFDSALGRRNVDVINDFKHNVDKIVLDNDIFLKVGKDGKLEKSAFQIGSKALDKDDRILSDSKTGALYYDEDGRGGDAAVQFATLWNKPGNLSYSDFLIG